MGQRRLIYIWLVISALPCGIFIVALCLSEYTVSREGAINLHNCPAESYIPIYLIVVLCLAMSLAVAKKINNSAQEKKDAGSRAYHPSFIVLQFITWCAIAGNYILVYKMYKPDVSHNNCGNLYHLLFFWWSTVIFILMTIYLVIGFIAFIAIVVLPKICRPCVRYTCVTCCSCCECGRKLCERMSSTQSDDKNPSNSVLQSGADPYTRY